MSLPPRWFLQYLCDVLEVDLGQAERLAYGEEVLYLPEGLYAEDVMYQLEDIKDSLSGGASYGILKLLLMAIFLRTLVQSAPTREECFAIRGHTPTKALSYNLENEIDRVKRRISFHPNDPSLLATKAKLTDELRTYEQCYLGNVQVVQDIVTQGRRENVFSERFSDFYILWTWLARIIGEDNIKYYAGAGIASVIAYLAAYCKRHNVNIPKQANTMLEKKEEAAEVPETIVRGRQATPGRRSASRTSRGTTPRGTPRGTPGGTPRGNSRRAGGGFLRGGFQDLFNEINAMADQPILLGGADCSKLEILATVMTVIIVVSFIVIFAQNNEFLAISIGDIFADIKTQYKIFMENLFGTDAPTGWIGEILRKTGGYIIYVCEKFETAFTIMTKNGFNAFMHDLYTNATKIPAYWATAAWPLFRSILQTFLTILTKITVGVPSAVWSTSNRFCMFALGKAENEPPTAKMITEVVKELSGTKKTEIKPLEKKINVAVKKLRVKKVKMTGSPKRKRLSPKT